jgi:hypothetical protein
MGAVSSAALSLVGLKELAAERHAWESDVHLPALIERDA